jgi:acetyl esterase/lipase
VHAPSLEAIRAMLKETGGAISSTVAPSDTSTSIVVAVAPQPQLDLGTCEVELHHDVGYAAPTLPDGTTYQLAMDVQVPRSPGRKPLVVYVTGGGFFLHAKANALPLRTFVAEAGFVVASIDYRTIGEGATFADGVADVRAAIRFLRDNADEYGIDPARVALWGESAGGYLAAMSGLTLGRHSLAGEDPAADEPVRAVIDKFGVGDFAALAADFDEATRAHYAGPDSNLAWYLHGRDSGRSPADDPATAARANPHTYVDAGAPPFLFLHGSADTVISPSATLLLHNALRAAGAESTRFVLTGASHGDLPFLDLPDGGLAWSTREVMGWKVDFLRAWT